MAIARPAIEFDSLPMAVSAPIKMDKTLLDRRQFQGHDDAFNQWAGYKFTINDPVKERTHTVPLPAILHRGSTGMYQPCNDGKQNDRLRNLPQ